MRHPSEAPKAITKMDLKTQVLMENEGLSERSNEGHKVTWEVFDTAGLDAMEHQIWRQRELPELLIHWLLLAEAKLNENNPVEDAGYARNEEGGLIALQIVRTDPLNTIRTDLERDIATWYVKHKLLCNLSYQEESESDFQQFGQAVAFLYHQFTTRTRARDWTTATRPERKERDVKRVSPSTTLNRSTEPRKRKGTLDSPTWKDLEKTDLSPDEIVRDCELKPRTLQPRKSGKKKQADTMPTKEGLSMAAYRAVIRAAKGEEGLPIRITTTQNSLWWRYAITKLGEGTGPGSSHRYGIIREPDSRAHPTSMT